MRSQQARNIIKNMSPEQLKKLNEHIELQRTLAIVNHKRIDKNLLGFVQDEAAGLHPHQLEPRHSHPRNGKCYIIQEGKCV